MSDPLSKSDFVRFESRMYDSITAMQTEIKALTEMSAEVKSYRQTVERVFRAIDEQGERIDNKEKAERETVAAIADLQSSRQFHWRAIVGVYAIGAAGGVGAVSFIWSKISPLL